MKYFVLTLCIFASVNQSLKAQSQKCVFPTEMASLYDEVKQKYVPDRREAMLDIKFVVEGRSVRLSGETDQSEAREELVSGIRSLGYEVKDEIRVLPDEAELDGRSWGIVDVSVCNLRTRGDYGEEQSSQALLGMPVRILKKDNWLQIQTPDRYLAWVLPSAVKRVTKAELEEWNCAPKVVVTSIFGFVYSKPSVNAQTVSDVVASDRLKLLGSSGKFYKVEYPDGRQGYIQKSACEPLDQWCKHIKQDAQSIISTGKRLVGIPYMWGGTSTKGVDCSGFVRTTLLMHDIIIPRDASLQAYKGQRIEIDADFSNLQAGDLLFFGCKATAGGRERVVHVGIYTGNKRFIHSLGYVREASFNPADSDYDEYDLGRLLFAARVLPFINKEKGLCTTDQNEFYK